MQRQMKAECYSKGEIKEMASQHRESSNASLVNEVRDDLAKTILCAETFAFKGTNPRQTSLPPDFTTSSQYSDKLRQCMMPSPYTESSNSAEQLGNVHPELGPTDMTQQNQKGMRTQTRRCTQNRYNLHSRIFQDRNCMPSLDNVGFRHGDGFRSHPPLTNNGFH